MKRAILSVFTGLVLLPLVGCGNSGPGHFDNDASCECESHRMAALRADPQYADVPMSAPGGATARELASGIGSDLVFEAGGNEVIQIDGCPDALNGSSHGRMSQDMAELMLRNVMEMQVDSHTGLPLYTVTVAGPGDRPTVKSNGMVAAETMKSQR